MFKTNYNTHLDFRNESSDECEGYQDRHVHYNVFVYLHRWRDIGGHITASGRMQVGHEQVPCNICLLCVLIISNQIFLKTVRIWMPVVFLESHLPVHGDEFICFDAAIPQITLWCSLSVTVSKTSYGLMKWFWWEHLCCCRLVCCGPTAWTVWIGPTLPSSWWGSAPWPISFMH